MYTHVAKDTTFIYNGDLSGNVTITRHGKEIQVPGSELIEFIAGHVQRTRIAALEGMSENEILGIPE